MFYCKECGNEFKKWYGRCPACKEYNTFVEFSKEEKLIKNNTKNQKNNILNEEFNNVELNQLNKVAINEDIRFITNIMEFNRVLGGGLVKGSLLLIGGQPGIGKSTLTLQVAEEMAQKEKTLYISGEESASQIKLRADRMQLMISDNFLIANAKNIDDIFELSLKNKIQYLVIDSIQTMYSKTASGNSGSVAQVKESTLRLMHFAKNNNITVIIIGHVTKDGEIAGPKLLEHMVDTVLYLEGEKNTGYKVLRSTKNRYGKVGEIGIFRMNKLGLKSVNNAEKFFLNSLMNVSGVAIGAVVEGERILFVEVQTLLINTEFGYPKRTSQGYDLQRLNLLLGVAQKRLNINFNSYDCYLNLSSGLKSKDVTLDLAVTMSLLSAKKDFILSNQILFLGEVSLTGEIKPVYRQDDIIEQALILGFTKIYANTSHEKCIKSQKIQDVYKDF